MDFTARMSTTNGDASSRASRGAAPISRILIGAGALAALTLAGWTSSGCGSEGDSVFGGDQPPDGGMDAPIGFGSDGGAGDCNKKTCAELGWACGYTVDTCGNVTNCADEGRTCASGQACVGGVDAPTTCVAAGGTCELCPAIPDCTGKPQKTQLKGRVITAGRADGNTGNQVGVPNAIVYILQSDKVADVPPIGTGIPAGGTSCDRCNEQDLGPVLVGAVTDAAGNYTLEGNIPVGREFLLIVKAGRFRRAVKHTIPAEMACATTTLSGSLPANPTRLPRSMTDGLAVNLPRIAISTGRIDAIECVFEKTGIAHGEFGNPGAEGTAAPRVHLYRGNNTHGAKINADTPPDTALYGAAAAGAAPRIQKYDLVVADCEGTDWDSGFTQRNTSGPNVQEYVNRGGRMFASHLSASWLTGNGTTPYSAATPLATGLGPAASWDSPIDDSTDTGTGVVSGTDRPRRSPRITSFAEWMLREGVVTGAPPLAFDITQPRSKVNALGDASEEFVYASRLDSAAVAARVQQFSFNTPYGAPLAAACGRVAYSGFHVVPKTSVGSGPYDDVTFPAHCDGDLTKQEKVLLYSLFDLSACVGALPVPPVCTPRSCAQAGATCGFTPDGCGQLVDCGPCSPK